MIEVYHFTRKAASLVIEQDCTDDNGKTMNRTINHTDKVGIVTGASQLAGAKRDGGY